MKLNTLLALAQLADRSCLQQFDSVTLRDGHAYVTNKHLAAGIALTPDEDPTTPTHPCISIPAKAITAIAKGLTARQRITATVTVTTTQDHTKSNQFGGLLTRHDGMTVPFDSTYCHHAPTLAYDKVLKQAATPTLEAAQLNIEYLSRFAKAAKTLTDSKEPERRVAIAHNGKLPSAVAIEGHPEFLGCIMPIRPDEPHKALAEAGVTLPVAPAEDVIL